MSLESEEFLSWLSVERGRASNTLISYRRDLRAFEEFLRLRSSSVRDATAPIIKDYVGFLSASGHGRASVARAMAVIRGLYSFLVEEGNLGASPAAQVGFPPPAPGLPKALSESEVLSIIEAVEGDSPTSLRDRAILEVLYGAGLRISELIGLSVSDLVSLMEPDLGFPSGPDALPASGEARMLKVFGKGSKERIVPIGRCARQSLIQWLSPAGRPALCPDKWARRGDSEALFLNARGGRLTRQGAWMIVKKWGDKAGLADKLSPHVLRHSCATHMLDHGADIRVVQELLGHASIGTTQIYTKVSMARLRTVYQNAHPRARIDLETT